MTSASGLYRQVGFWILLGWYDILSRYRSTVLGVFWIVIVNALNVAAIGFVYSSLFKISLENYFPYLVSGYIFWLFINSSLLEISGSLAAYRFILYSHPVDPLAVILRVYARNVIILLHNFPIILAVLALFSPNPGVAALYFVPNFLIASAGLVGASGVLAFLCARFRDVQMIINAAVAVLFLITPIIWSPEILTERAYIAYLNPLTHILDILRKPLLGEIPSPLNYAVSLGVSSLSVLLFVFVYFRFHKKYKNWL
jgi:lipopolysaccharide transport system permease protein